MRKQKVRQEAIRSELTDICDPSRHVDFPKQEKLINLPLQFTR